MSIESSASPLVSPPSETVKTYDTLTFVRHGEYIPGDNYGVDGTGLTQQGVQEARSLHGILTQPAERIIAYSVDNVRSLGTLTLALYPETETTMVASRARELMANGRLFKLDKLTYLPVNDPLLEDRLTRVYDNGENLSYLANESDDYIRQTGERFSSYSVMALDLTELILDHNNRDRSTNPDNDLLVCGREFIYACFRAELTKELVGAREKEAYIDWYQRHVELNDSARTETMDVRISSENGEDKIIKLTDSFGSLEFDVRTLEEMQKHLQETCNSLIA